MFTEDQLWEPACWRSAEGGHKKTPQASTAGGVIFTATA
jgi:hypothetical protein